ncbi:MAG TPA: DUF1028 domain-containing protein [Candidatus Nanopelagicaceae bacterium]
MKFNTFSITARCHRTGEMGIAVATKFVAVGALCSFIKNNVGAIASQAYVNPYLGIWGLEYLAQGHSAEETLAYLKDADKGIEFRQIGIVDNNGGSVAFTGERCDTWRGHLTGPNYAIAGNRLASARTLEAMKENFESDDTLPLRKRLLLALSAGEAAGGDKLGHQSAAIKVFGDQDFPLVDLRVDEHADPVGELRRIYGVAEEILIPLIGSLPTPDAETGNLRFRRSAIGKDGNPTPY